MFHYFLYYRVDPERTLEADAAVRQIQFDLETQFSVSGRLLKKRDEPLLWMEIYEDVSSSTEFEAALSQAEEKSGIQRYIQGDGKRHLECFVS